jgi:arylsulfatase A-like enzyme
MRRLPSGWPKARLVTAISVIGIGLSTLVLGGCERRPPSKSRAVNIVLITVDTLRADRLGPYGYTRNRTPSIERLSREGILYEHAFCDSTWTLPSISSVLTGKYPTEHGVHTWYDQLHDEEITLAELLKARGYRTAAIVGSFPLDRSFGFAQGYDHYDDEMNTPLLPGKNANPSILKAPRNRTERGMWIMARKRSSAYRPDNEVADRAIAWLDDNTDQPFFLWVHFFGPHEKGNVRRTKDSTKKAISAYDPDVEFADLHVGRVVTRLLAEEKTDEPVIIFHSDHGQSLMERGIFGHGLDLYETTAAVPLIVRLPGGERAGSRISRLVRNVDIFSTILHLGGTEIPKGTRGVDLLGSGHGDNHAYLETHLTRDDIFGRDIEVGGVTVHVGTFLRGVRTQEWKLIVKEPRLTWAWEDKQGLPANYIEEHRRFELYNVAADPQEKSNLISSSPEVVLSLLTILGRYKELPRGVARRRGLDDSEKERLRSLGYLE